MAKVRRKISRRFRGTPEAREVVLNGEVVEKPAPVIYKQFPKNFKLLFAFPQKFCSCHGTRMTVRNIFYHSDANFNSWLNGLLTVPKSLITGWKAEVCSGEAAPRALDIAHGGRSAASHQWGGDSCSYAGH